LNKANVKNGSGKSQEQKKKMCKTFIEQANKYITSATNNDVAAAQSAIAAAGNAKTVCKELYTNNANGDGANARYAKMCEVTIPSSEDITTSNISTEKTKISTAIQNIESACEAADTDVDPNDKGNKAARIAIPIATSIAGGALGAGITASVIKQKKENIRNEAAQKWMDEVGSHIQCYVGAEELGTYGDVVSITLD